MNNTKRVDLLKYISYFNSLSSRNKRLLSIICFFTISFVFTLLGLISSITYEEAEVIIQQIEPLQQNISVQLIFGNNFMICLFMFVPVIGHIIGFYILYNTGIVIAAQSVLNNVSPFTSLIFLFIFPVAWLEFFAYSLSFAENFWLTKKLIHRKGKSELYTVCVFISICAVLLIIAAISEVILITLLT